MTATAGPMVAALEAAGSAVEHLVVDGRDHFSINLGMANPEDPWVLRAADWDHRFAC